MTDLAHELDAVKERLRRHILRHAKCSAKCDTAVELFEAVVRLGAQVVYNDAVQPVK